MSTFDYFIQGVPLTDTRWRGDSRAEAEGCWFPLTGTSVLPKFPGARVTRFERPGQNGEDQVQHAPINPTTHEFNIRFLPIDPNHNRPTYRKQGRTWEERMVFLEENINDFFFRTMLGQTLSGGEIEIQRHSINLVHFPQNEGEDVNGVQSMVGRFIASSEAELDRDALWADYTLIFDNRSGVWHTDWQYVSATCTAGETTAIEIPMGTAPVDDVKLAFRRLNSDASIPKGTTFLNHMGIGFEVMGDVNDDRWRVMDTKERAANHGGSGADPLWHWSMVNPTFMAEVGRPLGSALNISPGVAGDSRRIGRVNVTPTADMEVRVAVRPRFF